MSFEEEKTFDFDYEYDLRCFKVDTMNKKLNGGKDVLPIAYIMDDNEIPKEKRIKLLDQMINSLAVEIGEAVANGDLPELKKLFEKF